MSETLTLRELSDEANALLALSDMDDGEWTDEHENMERELAGQLALKADRYGDFISDRLLRIAALKREEARLAKRRKAEEGRLERLHRYATTTLKAMGRDRVEGERYTLTVQPNPPKVKLAATVVPALLPPGFQRTVPASIEPDLSAIKDALKLGEKLDFATLEHTYSLRIR